MSLLLVAKLKSNQTGQMPIPVAIEGNADLIVRELHAAGFPLVLIPPYSVNQARGAYDPNHSKTDELDAVLLANMLRLNQHKWIPRTPIGENTQAMRLAARAQRDEGYRGLKIAQQMRSLMRVGHSAILPEFVKNLTDYKTVNVLRDVPNPTVAPSLAVDDWVRILRKAGPYQKVHDKAVRLYEASQAPGLLLPPAVEAAYGERLLPCLPTPCPYSRTTKDSP